MKIGILTFHCAANYGAVLQAYGLQEYIKTLGHEVYVINYRPKYLFTPYKNFAWSLIPEHGIFTNLKELIRACLLMPIKIKRNTRIQSFIKRYLNIYNLDLNNRHNDFDAFIFGSDQIWNPNICNGFDDIYIGNFKAARNKKKIAYAASTGSINYLNQAKTTELLQNIASFSATSVRERTIQLLLNKNSNKEVKLVVDPVLLAGRNTFNEIAHNIKVKKPYLLLFQLIKNPTVSKYAQAEAQRLGLYFVEIVSQSNSLKDRKLKQALSPQDFLGYIKNATYVISTSFHGTALSILFEKEFTTISVNENIDERAGHLLNVLGLKNRIHSINMKLNNSSINYSEVNVKMQYLRNESIDFLKSALS